MDVKHNIDGGSTIESFLGSPEGRYFGSGYKKVRYIQRQEEMTRQSINSVFEIQYPKNWSTKENIKEIVPHFSSLDSVVLAVKVILDYLKKELEIDEQTINSSLISNLSIKAGKSLVEDLKNVGVHLKRVSQDSLAFKGKVASFSVELSLELFENSNKKQEVSQRDYYYTAFKDSEKQVKDIVIDQKFAKISSVADFKYKEQFTGIESEYILKKSLPSILDQIIATAELTEVLHSKLDKIPREKSKTLIMRKIKFHRTVPTKTDTIENRLSIEIIKTKVVCVKDKTMRISDMVSTWGNSIFTYSVAQELV
ncbi:AvrD family protein [Streptococcus sobrinus]|uniref:AvrD family protein n=1 Tax=Streptococcus sobrinus TaxID=1310 RepID=UPI0002E0263C|nr:AvrD family protein [Streptococcus sobrinus]